MTHISYSETLPDSHHYLVLFNTTGWNESYKTNANDLAEALKNSWYMVTAYDGDDLVGFGRVVSDGILYAMIYDMIVKPSHQGMGIGSKILDKLVAKCRASGIRAIQLFSASGKMGFYTKRGFIKRPPDGQGMSLKKDEV